MRKVIIIGYNPTAKKLAGYLQKQKTKTEIVGYCDDEEKVNELSDYPIISNLYNTVHLCTQQAVTEIYSTISPAQNPNVYSIMKAADDQCIRFKIIPDFNWHADEPSSINYYKDLPVLSMRKMPLDNPYSKIKKRSIDLCISIAAIILILSWMIPLIGLLIWLDDKGPIFFIQKRSGKDNKTFNCIKFRSMKKNLEADSRQATIDDERITRIGKFLRCTNLDEFPQFLNVFTGDMSVVGPRPHMLKHTHEFSRLIDQYMARHFVKPGITGWAQANGFRGETKTIKQMQGRVECDLWYIENWSFILDARIILLTIRGTIKGDENAF
jgi:putative colanic acid biosynthesis UDP-glucose lipid carrier transferase